MAMRTRHNTLFSGARSIKLRDGSFLSTDDPRTLKSIVHQQLQTHKNKFNNRTESARKERMVAQATRVADRRNKAINPHKHNVESVEAARAKARKTFVLNNPPPPKNMPFPVTKVKQEPTFKEEMDKDGAVVRYH